MSPQDAPFKILFVTSELSPLISTGGLAEVAGSLPRALRAQGHDVRVIMPCYRGIPDRYRGEPYCLCEAELGEQTQYGQMRKSAVPDSDIPLYLIEHEGYFGREKPYGVGAYEYSDNAERFCFFCLAVLHAVPQLHWQPDVIHCHDWHTAALPVFLRTRYEASPLWGRTPTVFTIHNLSFQGRYGVDKLPSTGIDMGLFQDGRIEYQGDINLLKGAIAFSTKINTVSPRYAEEIQTLEYGDGLDGMLRTRAADISGILNGVDYDIWDPETDPHIPANYSETDLAGKAACKKALQATFGLPQRDVPLFGILSRLYWQKGLSLAADVLDLLVGMDAQLAVLGTGDPELEARFSQAAARYPENIGVALRFDVALSHQVLAGSDFLLMPSRYEPCGLAQMYAMAYGTVPIVRRTGGLADSVRDLNPVHRKHGNATGFSFVPMTSQALGRAVEEAVALFKKNTEFQKVRRADMAEDFSWDRSCQQYVELYREAVASV